MKYTKKACEKADEILSQRRQKDKEEYQKHLNEIEINAPEIANMNRRINMINLEMLKLIGSGKKNDDVQKKIKEIKEKNYELSGAIKNMLLEFGYPEDYMQMHYHCSKCRDYGSFEGVRCSCLTELLEKFTAEELNENCSVKRHDFSEFREDFYPLDIVDGRTIRERMKYIFFDCKKYAENFNEKSPSILFRGGTGLGKTFLSSCIATALLDKGVNVVFGSILDLIRKMNDEYFKKAEGNTAEILKSAELLIMDDLGSEFQTPFGDSALYEIINYRLNMEKPTIISTNLTLDEMNRKYNERIISRIQGNYILYKFLGNDIRPAIRNMNLRNMKKRND